jgi:hypothetical protein
VFDNEHKNMPERLRQPAANLEAEMDIKREE